MFRTLGRKGVGCKLKHNIIQNKTYSKVCVQKILQAVNNITISFENLNTNNRYTLFHRKPIYRSFLLFNWLVDSPAEPETYLPICQNFHTEMENRKICSKYFLLLNRQLSTDDSVVIHITSTKLVCSNYGCGLLNCKLYTSILKSG